MPTILVVDDDPQISKPLARLLKMEGYEVVCAANAVCAMAQAMGQHPDLILLDVAMPPIDGLTFLFLLRDKSFGKDLPVIVLTGQSDDGTVRRARELGVCEYLIKGQYKTSELVELVRHYCPLRPAEAAADTGEAVKTGPAGSAAGSAADADVASGA